MKNLFGEGCHPVTGTALGRAYRTRCGGRVRPDVLAGEVGLDAVGGRAARGRQQVIQQAHDAAVLDALAFLEDHAIFTREGTDGARQVETRGLIAAAFTAPRLARRRSGPAHPRRGREQGPDPRGQVALDLRHGAAPVRRRRLRGLQHRARSTTSASTSASGSSTRPAVRVSGRSGRSPASTPAVRTVVAAAARDIEDRTGELTADFTASTAARRRPRSRSPWRSARTSRPAQAKHEPRSEAEQRATWQAEAVQELGRARPAST